MANINLSPDSIISNDSLNASTIVGSSANIIDENVSTGWGFTLTGTGFGSYEYAFTLALNGYAYIEQINIKVELDNVPSVVITNNINTSAGAVFESEVDVVNTSTATLTYVVQSYGSYVRCDKLFVEFNTTNTFTFKITEVEVIGERKALTGNVALSATPTTSNSVPSAFWSSVFGSADFINNGVIEQSNRYAIFHNDTYTSVQEDTATIIAELDFGTSTSVKKSYVYGSVISEFYSDNYFNLESRLYYWNGLTWTLESTQTLSLAYDSEKTIYTFGFVKEVNLSATKYKLELDIDYKLNYNAGSPTSLTFSLNEWELYNTLNTVDINLFQDTSKTLTGSPNVTQSQDYMVDGFTDAGSIFFATSTSLVVYDVITTFDQAYNISAMYCDIAADGEGAELYGAGADIDWEFQVFTTEWTSIATGSLVLDNNIILSTAASEFTSVSATKSRFIISLSNITILTAFPIVFLNNFRAFTEDVTAIDIGLRIGSQTIGAVVADSSPLKIYVNGTTYSIPLVDTTDSTASAARIYTDSVRALRQIT